MVSQIKGWGYLFYTLVIRVDIIYKPFQKHEYAVVAPLAMNMPVSLITRELVWHSGSVMDSNATVQGSIPGQYDVFTELHVLHKGH